MARSPTPPPAPAPVAPAPLPTVPVAPAAQASGSDSDSSDDYIGPRPPSPKGEDATGLGGGAAAVPGGGTGGYGKALRPGEGAAIAQFVQAGKRVPRRGEVGWTGDDIAQMESLGYVMSGNRNKRMNAVRLRKENQVYTEEEKRELARFNFEAQQAREAKLMGEFKDILAAKGMLEGEEAPAPAPAPTPAPAWGVAK